jgi:hypothetical protein
MRRNLPVLLLLAAVPLAAVAQTAGDPASEARALSARLQQLLQTELFAAMKDGGPLKAIEVCRSRAPILAADLSKDSGWKLGRTAIRVRNPANAPDAWERKTLEEFGARLAKGEDPASVEKSEVVEVAGRKTFRYMKAIRTAEPCLGCHGPALKPELAAKVKEFYPDDRATGFAAGELRGAFTVSRPM